MYWSICCGTCSTTACDGCCAAAFHVVTRVSILRPKAGPDDECIAARLEKRLLAIVWLGEL